MLDVQFYNKTWRSARYHNNAVGKSSLAVTKMQAKKLKT